MKRAQVAQVREKFTTLQSQKILKDTYVGSCPEVKSQGVRFGFASFYSSRLLGSKLVVGLGSSKKEKKKKKFFSPFSLQKKKLE